MIKQKSFDWKDSNVALIGSDEDRSVKKESAMKEPVWQPILKCTSPRLFVFRINKFKVESVPQEDYGTFFNGDSYIVLNVYKVEDKLEYDVHFWIGQFSTQDEYGTAAYKTVELDTLLDDRPVQHREVEGNESPLFKSYFHKMTVLSGGYESGFRHVTPATYQPRLLHFCKKGNRMEIQEVSFTRRSLDSGDVYILDLGDKAIQWNGKSCNALEKHAAAKYLQDLESMRNGKVKSEVVDEIDQQDDREFRSKLPDDEVAAKPFHGGSFQKKIFKMSDESGELKFTCISEGSAPRSCLNEDDVYFVQGSDHLYVYIGENCSPTEKKNALLYGSDLLNKSENPCVPLTVVNQKTAGPKGMNKYLD